jgi:putative phage-type endonuclease
VTATLVGTFATHSKEWHAARRDRIGGSEVAAILGLSKWDSPFSLWHRKRGEIGEQTENPQMSWGTRLEPVILDKFFEDHPELQRLPVGTMRSDARPWQIANPDALGFDGDKQCIVECKTAMYADQDEWGPAFDEDGEPTDRIPIYYRCQVLWYMDCLGVDTAWVCVLIGGSDYREYLLKYDASEARYLRGHAAAFIHAVRHNVRPDIDGHIETYKVVKTLPEGVTDDVATVSLKDARAYRTALDRAKAADEEKRRATSVILDAIGDGKTAETPDGLRIATRAVTKTGRTHALQPTRVPKEKK